MAGKQEEEGVRIVHFALSENTECGKYIAAGTYYTDSTYEDEYDPQDETIVHSSDPDFVTCEKCKKGKRYLKEKNESA